LEQEITNLRAQLELQQQSSDTTQHRHKEENEQLQQSLSESQEKVKLADSTIRILKRDQESQRIAEAQLEDRLAKLQNEAKTKQAELTASIESERQETESLRQQLKLAKIQSEDPSALQRIKEENMLLKRKIKGMREVQLEMESQLIVDGDNEIRKLHEQLRATQAKLNNAEKLAEQSKSLSRENQIHVSAIDMLSEDLDTLTEEKKSLIVERDGLMKELSKIRKHYAKLASKNDLVH
jgi:chromosome segregation ATPase